MLDLTCPSCKLNFRALNGHETYPYCANCMDVNYPDWRKRMPESPRSVMFVVRHHPITRSKPPVTDEYVAEKMPSGGYWLTNETVGSMTLPSEYLNGTPRTLADVKEFFRQMGGEILLEEVIDN